jgi:hypothetical protein
MIRVQLSILSHWTYAPATKQIFFWRYIKYAYFRKHVVDFKCRVYIV